MIKKIIKKNGVRYRLLDYIESTGTQSIKLGNAVPFNTDNTVLECDFQFTEIATDSNAKWLFSNQDSKNHMVDFYSQVNTDLRGFYIRPSASQQGAAGVVIQHDTNKHHMKADFINKKFYFDDNVYNMSYTQTSQTAPMYLFRRSNTDTGYSKAKLFNFKYTRMVHHDYDFDLIPVERVSDGAIGMLNLINNTFYTNAGTGTFEKGYIQKEHVHKHKYKAKTYEILDCITSDGNQYIKLGVSGNGLSEWDLKFKADNRIGTDWSVIFGHRPSGTSADDLEICAYNISSGSSFNQIANDATNSRVTTGQVGTTTTWRCIKQGNKLSIKDYREEPTFNNTFKQNPSLTFTLEDYLFALNVNNAVSYTSIATFYYLKYYANSVLDRDLIPVKRLSDNEIGVYDRVRKQFYGNSGTGAFTGQSLSTPEYIEEDVEQVDYIQSSGTQYFYSGITASFNFKMELDIDILETGGQCGCDDLLIGLNAIEGTNGRYIARIGTNGRYIARIGKNGTVLSKEVTLRRHTIVLDAPNNSFTIDGDTSAVSRGSTPGTTNMAILARRGTGGDSFQIKGKLYGCKIWESNVLKRDYIPVKYGTEYCMLDLVEMKLYHNKGTGSFSGGNRTKKVESKLVIKKGTSRYRVLDYIENTSQSYINLGIACNQVKNIELDFMGTIAWANDQIAFGAYSNIYKGSNYLQLSGGATRVYGNSYPNTLYNGLPTLNKKYKATIPMTSTGMAYLYEEGVQKGSVNIPSANQETLDMLLFTLNLNGSASASHYTKMKVYSFKGWGLDDKLLFNYIPVERISDGAIGMFDLVNGDFHGNNGSGTFEKGNYIKKVYDDPIPDEYQRVDYIKGTGTQYINTDLQYDASGLKLELKFKINELSTSLQDQNGLWGSTNAPYVINGNSYDYGQNGRIAVYNTPVHLNFDTDVHTLILDSETSSAYLDGVAKATKMTFSKAPQYKYSIMFLGGNSGISILPAKMNLYYCKMWNNGELVGNFVPVKRKSDNVLGVYDSVSNTFLTNAGTGTFISG